MSHSPDQGVRYDARHAAAYDRKIRQLIPGYDVLHELSAFLLRELLPSAANVLVAGSGSGEELTRLAAHASDWRLTGIEPSAEMNALAAQKCAAAGVDARVSLIAGKPGEVDMGSGYDAATALLVLHFLPDDGSKAAFLQALGRALKPGGVLVLADLTGERESEGFGLLFQAWRRQQDATRERQDHVALDFAHLERNVYPMAPARRDALLAEAGFGVAGEYWRAYGLAGVWARRVG